MLQVLGEKDGIPERLRMLVSRCVDGSGEGEIDILGSMIKMRSQCMSNVLMDLMVCDLSNLKSCCLEVEKRVFGRLGALRSYVRWFERFEFRWRC